MRLTDLPPEILAKILTFCDTISIVKLRRCCTMLNTFSRDRDTWHRSMLLHIQESNYHPPGFPLMGGRGLELLATAPFRLHHRVQRHLKESAHDLLLPTSSRSVNVSGSQWILPWLPALGQRVFTLADGMLKVWDLALLCPSRTLEPMYTTSIPLSISPELATISCWDYNPDGRLAFCVRELHASGTIHHIRYVNHDEGEIEGTAYHTDDTSFFELNLDRKGCQVVQGQGYVTLIWSYNTPNQTTLKWTNISPFVDIYPLDDGTVIKVNIDSIDIYERPVDIPPGSNITTEATPVSSVSWHDLFLEDGMRSMVFPYRSAALDIMLRWVNVLYPNDSATDAVLYFFVLSLKSGARTPEVRLLGRSRIPVRPDADDIRLFIGAHWHLTWFERGDGEAPPVSLYIIDPPSLSVNPLGTPAQLSMGEEMNQLASLHPDNWEFDPLSARAILQVGSQLHVFGYA